jgi:hypothetical protein
MERICITIEEKSLGVLRKKISGKEETVLQVRRMALPTALQGAAQRDKPAELAKFIASHLKTAKVAGQNLSVYLGSGIEQRSEFSCAKSGDARKKRLTAEIYSLLSMDANDYFIESYDYSRSAGTNIAALTAVPGDFCRKLVKAFKGEGYSVLGLYSQAQAFAARMEPELKAVSPEDEAPFDTALGLSVEEDGIAFVQRSAAGIGHVSLAVPDATLSSVPRNAAIDSALMGIESYVKGKTKIVLCGSLAGEAEHSEALLSLGDVTVRAPSVKTPAAPAAVPTPDAPAAEPPQAAAPVTIPTAKALHFAGEMEGREALLLTIWPLLGKPPGVHLPDYLSGGSENRKSQKTAKIAVAALAMVVLIACSVPLIHMGSMFLSQQKNEASLEETTNAALRAKIDEHRELTVTLSEYEGIDAIVPEEGASKVQLLKTVKAELLGDADITELYAEEGGALSLAVVLPESEQASFDSKKAKMNDQKKYVITEPGPRVESPSRDGYVIVSLKVERV